IVLSVWGLVVLLADFFVVRRKPSAVRQQVLGWFSLVGVLGTLAVATLAVIDRVGGDNPDPYILYGLVSDDALTDWMNLLLVLLLFLVTRLSMVWAFTENWGEYFSLLLWSTAGMMLLIAAEELLTLFLALELMTICLYVLTSFEKDRV